MILDATALATRFGGARTHYDWTDQVVSDDELRQVFGLLRDGPTSANCSPARFLFLRTMEAKQRLRPALSAGNVPEVLTCTDASELSDEASQLSADLITATRWLFHSFGSCDTVRPITDAQQLGLL